MFGFSERPELGPLSKILYSRREHMPKQYLVKVDRMRHCVTPIQNLYLYCTHKSQYITPAASVSATGSSSSSIFS